MGRVGEVCGITEAEAKTAYEGPEGAQKPGELQQVTWFVPEDERVYSSALWGNGAEHFNRTWTSSTERVALGL